MTPDGRAFEYPADLAQVVLDRFQALDDNARAWLHRFQMPDQRVITVLLEGAFFAGLKAEEQWQVHGALALVPSDPDPPPNRSTWSPFVLEQPVLFSPEAVCKMLRSVDSSQAALGIWPGEDGQLLIWGVLRYGASLHRSLQDQSDRGGMAPTPHFLRVELLGPGVLRVSIGFVALARIKDGRVLPAGLRVLDRYGPTLRRLGRLHREVRETVRLRPWHTAVRAVLRELQVEGAGGLVLLVPTAWQPADGAKGYLTRRSEPNADLLTRLSHSQSENRNSNTVRARLRGGGPPLRRDEVIPMLIQETFLPILAQEWRDAARQAARLGAVDGALVLAADLSVRAFGYHVEAGQTPSAAVYLDERAQKKSSDWKPSGLRHSAALRFCATHPDAIAFVCSHDGDASVFLSGDAGLLGWRDIEVAERPLMRSGR